MVKALHAAGLEVILDVVFNHTAEGNEDGPTLCFRGLDNAGYYRLVPGDLARYFDTTGHRQQPGHRPAGLPAAGAGLAAVLDHRATEWTVSGSTWPRRWPGRTARSPGCRTSSTPCTRTRSSRRSSSSPSPGTSTSPTRTTWAASRPAGSEWNGKYRDTVRSFWRSEAGTLGRPRHPGHRLPGPVRTGPQPPVRLGEHHHHARRVHPAGPGLLRLQAQRRQRARPGRRGRQPVLELRGRGPDRRPGRRWRCGRGSPGRCWPRCSCPAACRCCSAGTSWAGPSAATTTRTARTTRSPGTTGPLWTTTCSTSPAG